MVKNRITIELNEISKGVYTFDTEDLINSLRGKIKLDLEYIIKEVIEETFDEEKIKEIINRGILEKIKKLK